MIRLKKAFQIRLKTISNQAIANKAIPEQLRPCITLIIPNDDLDHEDWKNFLNTIDHALSDSMGAYQNFSNDNGCKIASLNCKMDIKIGPLKDLHDQIVKNPTKTTEQEHYDHAQATINYALLDMLENLQALDMNLSNTIQKPPNEYGDKKAYAIRPPQK